MPADNPDELFIQVDEADQEIGKVTRAKAHSNPNIIHRAVYVLIVNDQQQMLFHKRSAKKDLFPGMWAAACAGHVQYGSNYRETAKRELGEELKIKCELFLVTKLLLKTASQTEFCEIYMGKYSDAPVNFDPEEVQEITWVKLREIPIFIRTHRLTPGDEEVLRQLLYI
jgi:isopentenyl-diphosphate Delta-isomerase